MRTLARSVVLVLLALGACGEDRGGGPTFEVPKGDPATLPKVAADATAIGAMLRERFGDDVARNVEVEVSGDAGAAQVRLRGEVPNEALRDAVMREVAARVTGMAIQDFALEVSGPVRLVWSFPVDAQPDTKVVFSSDLSIAVTDRGAVHEVATGRRLNRLVFDDDREARAIAISPDGRTLATGHEGAQIVLWSLPEGVRAKVVKPKGPPTEYDAVLALSFSGDGKTLVSVQRKRGQIFAWDLEKGTARLVATHQPESSARGDQTFYAAALSPDGRALATTTESERGAILWDVEARKRSDFVSVDLFDPRALAWSSSGRTLVLAHESGSAYGTVLLYEPASKRTRRYPPESTGRVRAVALSQDERTLAVAYDSKLRLSDVDAGKPWVDLASDKVGAGDGVRFSTDGRLLATSSAGLSPPQIRLWDVSSRAGGPGGAASLPPAYPKVATRDDLLVATIASAIRGSFDRRSYESMDVELLPDGGVRLFGKVAAQPVKDHAGRTAATVAARGDPAHREPRRVVNDLEVTGRYGR
jgi:WD40 repeat protein